MILIIAFIAVHLTGGARAFVMAGESVRFDEKLLPHFTENQMLHTSLETRTGLVRWAETAGGRALIARFNAREYEIDIAEDVSEEGAGRAPQPALGTLVAAGDHGVVKRYVLILNPQSRIPPGRNVFPTAQPVTQTDLMAAAWAGEMLHVDFYSRGISLPHHSRPDFQEAWREVARQLGYPDMKHEDEEPIVRYVANH